MALRAVEHTFTGTTNQWDATYDSTKTTLGDLIRQYTGITAREKYAGPVRFGRDAALTTTYGVARPMETATAIPGIFPHVVQWANKGGYYSTGTVSVSGLTVTLSGGDWLTDGVPVGALIGFNSNDPGQITTWYTITAITSATVLTVSSPPGSLSGVNFVINKALEKDWVFLADNAAAAATRRITLFEYDRLTSNFSWRGFITMTYPATAAGHNIKGMRAVYAKYTTGTVTVASTNNVSSGTVTVAGTAVTCAGATPFVAGMVGMSMGFYTTNPALVTQWYVISAVGSTTTITLATTAGTVAAGTSYVIATTTVTGSGTTWNADRIMVGSRIGFGSTDPTQISQWHYVSGLTAATGYVSSDTTFYIQATPTANGVAGVTSNVTYGAGTSYVIEDLRILTATLNTTTANNGGLFTTYGVSYDDFTNIGTTIAAATTVDKVKAVYWLADAATVLNTSAAGLAIEARVDWVTQYCHVLDTAGQVYKYNFRKALTTMTSGKETTPSTLVFKTGVQSPAIIGTMSSTNNGRIGTLSHGTGSGVSCLYFATTTCVYRIPLNSATYASASTNWASSNCDVMVETPPGGLSTYNTSSVLTAVEIADQIDRLIVTGTGAGTITYSTFSTGTVTVSGNIITHSATGFLAAHVGQYVGFGTTDPSAVTAWFLISYFNSTSVLNLATSAAAFNGAGVSFVISSNTPANNRSYLTKYYGTYIMGTATVNNGTKVVTGTNTTFNSGHAGQYIGFYTTNANLVSAWYLISSYTNATSITLSTAPATISTATAFVIAPANVSTNYWDMPFGVDTRQIDQSTASNDLCPTPSPQGAALNVWSEAGLLYISRTGTTAATNQVYAIPIGADWDFANGTVKQRLITPSLATTNATKLKRVIVNSEDYLGNGGLRLPTESYRVYYRTSNITSDASTGWTLLDSTGDLSAASPSTNIQFMFEFRTIGTFCLPARIYSVSCLYEDNTTDSHYQPSVKWSDVTNKRFAWRFSTPFGGTVPTLRIRLYNITDNVTPLVDDDSVTQAGTWEKSTDDGATWVAYNTTDKSNDITYIRYTRASLSDNIRVRALLTQN